MLLDSQCVSAIITVLKKATNSSVEPSTVYWDRSIVLAVMEPNHLYQFSLLNALMSGVCSTGITVKDFSQKGTQGIGTFAHMDGELVFLSGKVYQLQASGTVREAGPDELVPFAVSTHFVPQVTRSDVRLDGKGSIETVIEDSVQESANLFVTWRVEGRFRRLKCRTVRGQQYEGQPLSELGKTQTVEEYDDICGTIIGFRSPAYYQGFGVAGEHLHFISADRQRGGHVLEIEAEGVEMQMAVASNIHIELPTSADFNNAKLQTDDEGVKAVEG